MSADKNRAPAVVWTIAGLDTAGGAGLVADVKACESLEVHACPVAAALTAQNSVAVSRIEAVEASMLDAQLAALAADMPPAVIKTGMLGSAANVREVVRWVQRLRSQADESKSRPPVLLVVDPVLRASTGASLVSVDLLAALRDELLPLADVVTPNRTEAAALLGRVEPMQDDATVERAAHALQKTGCRTVVITGGDASGTHEAHDYLATPQASGWLMLPRVPTRHNHGTGCTFASTIAAALARGFCEADAVVLGKMGTTHALRRGYAAGAGAGPVRAGSGWSHDASLLPRFGASARNAPAGFASLRDDQLGLYAVVGSADWIERVLQAGIRTAQLRIKQADHPHLRAEIQRSIAAAQAANAQLFINDHWALAIELGAYGVHLGQEDLATADLQAIHAAGLRLGISTHSYWEVSRAWALRPSYIACGPIQATDSKAMPWVPQGFGNLAYWSRLLPLPVVGIGGLDAGNIGNARSSGAASAAVIRALTQASDLQVATTDLQVAWHRDAHDAIAVPIWPRATLPASRTAARPVT